MSEFSTAIRQFVALRADFRCEYCRKPEIISKTDLGEGTLRLLEFNALDRVLERNMLIELGFYP